MRFILLLANHGALCKLNNRNSRRSRASNYAQKVQTNHLAVYKIKNCQYRPIFQNHCLRPHFAEDSHLSSHSMNYPNNTNMNELNINNVSINSNTNLNSTAEQTD